VGIGAVDVVGLAGAGVADRGELLLDVGDGGVDGRGHGEVARADEPGEDIDVAAEARGEICELGGGEGEAFAEEWQGKFRCDAWIVGMVGECAEVIHFRGDSA